MEILIISLVISLFVFLAFLVLIIRRKKVLGKKDNFAFDYSKNFSNALRFNNDSEDIGDVVNSLESNSINFEYDYKK